MMKLMCPRCGEETAVVENTAFACEHCGGWLQAVSHGKEYVLVGAYREHPGEKEALALVDKADKIVDPVKKKKLLDEAETVCPDSLRVQQALLYLGDLWKRDLRNIDYHLIKCYLLHVFEEPEKETPAMRESMMTELTAHPRLLRCLELAPDRDAFIQEYVHWLCREYVHLFLKGSTSRTGKVFGFQLTRIEKALARPVAMMLRNMEQANLPAPYDTLLPRTLMEVFVRDVGPDVFVREAQKELAK